MNRLTTDQVRRNQKTRDNWENAAEHRQRVTEGLVRGFEAGEARLCVLGAGNCNDLDLVTLLSVFREVALVDLDDEALRQGVARQEVSDHAGLRIHAPVDITGAWDQLGSWDAEHPPTDDQIDSLLDTLTHPQELDLGEPFDLTASICLLSQLVEAAVTAVGEKHPRFLEVITTLRKSHVQRMLEQTKPGGLGFLVTDFVSSDTAPALRAVPDTELPRLSAGLIEQNNFFHGLNPVVLGRLLQDDAELAPRIEYCQLMQPWRWRLGERVYAVTALKFRRN